MAGLVGSGDVTAISRWQEDENGTVVSAGLDVVVGRSLRRVVSGQHGLIASSVDSGRIAVLSPLEGIACDPGLGRYEGSVVRVYAVSGRLLRTIKPGLANDVALRGDWLLVLTDRERLAAYDVRTGRRLHSWKIAPTASQLDAYGGVAVYAASSTIHAVRLSTGKDAVVGKASVWSQTGVVGIEKPGVTYVRAFHDIVFVPFARILAMVTPRTSDAAGR
jgi:hypothetical protein